ncbi:hypothetical protein DENIS_2292 [Desulfonema ishimotonii]|uniref:Uncharacterized protein n=1 Tax=Desulfonema ishimotonii TaxID=45657 RepID=A0A401FWF3_9BACT|nr:hypothetical protein [Desulfonema ishimotonii]GBC61332.1 hypothetical protein DENIS_2292 [Desulfonema ishimotonii]
MKPNEFSEAVIRVAEGMLKSHYPDGIPGIPERCSDEYIRRFVLQGLGHTDIGRLTSRELILLFEKYCEFEQMKAAYSENDALHGITEEM